MDDVVYLFDLGTRYLAEGDGFALVEHTLPARALGSPLHRHANEDEYSYVLEGRLGAQLGRDVVEADPGELEQNSSSGRTDRPHSSQSTTASEENAAPHEGHRRNSSPPHCGQVSGTSASKSSNQRRAAPQPRQNATQSPRTFRRSSRSQSAAFATS